MGAVLLSGLAATAPQPQAVLLGGQGRKMYKFRQIEFFAKNGAVYMFDNRNGHSEKIDPEEIERRAESQGEASKRMTDPQVRSELEKLANDLRECAARARDQGSLWDERVQAHVEMHTPSTRVFHGADLPK